MAKSGLQKMFEGMGVPDLDTIYPKKICENCLQQSIGCSPAEGGRGCGALTTIGMLAAGAAKNKTDAKAFMSNLKEAIARAS